MQYFSTDFLAANHDFFQTQGRYHIAQKRIQTIDGEVDGVKLEAFIFDPFVTAERAFVFEVEREAQFAPVKNRPGAANDTPEAARRQVMLLHAEWVRRAGGTVEGEGGLEVSRSVSVAGEGLEELCAGRTFAAGSLVVGPAGGGSRCGKRPVIRAARLGAHVRPIVYACRNCVPSAPSRERAGISAYGWPNDGAPQRTSGWPPGTHGTSPAPMSSAMMSTTFGGGIASGRCVRDEGSRPAASIGDG